MEELATQWMHFIRDIEVCAGDNSRRDAQVGLEGRTVANVTRADLQKDFGVHAAGGRGERGARDDGRAGRGPRRGVGACVGRRSCS